MTDLMYVYNFVRKRLPDHLHIRVEPLTDQDAVAVTVTTQVGTGFLVSGLELAYGGDDLLEAKVQQVLGSLESVDCTKTIDSKR